jgi:hypothetical protein
MTISDYEYRYRILLSLNNKLIEFADGTYRNYDWFNQEDLHRTMKNDPMQSFDSET